jgi:Flp pilus assembly protein TadG
MRWLKRDQGFSLVLVGLILAVLMGLTGMAVDLGSVYGERRQLRNGADAAALAIAEDCGTRAKACDVPTAQTTAQIYADANARDGSSGVEQPQLTLTGETTGSVRVVTYAVQASTGESGVPVPLMHLLGFDRVSVQAAATAIFDHPSEGQGLPLVIESWCLQELGEDNSGYVLLHQGSARQGQVGSCQQSDPAGHDAPGAFGWVDIDTSLPLDLTLGDCQAFFQIDTWDNFADPGHGAGQPPKECEASTLLSAIYQKKVMVAVYDEVRAQGNNTQYYVIGFTGFFVEGYRLGNKSGFFQLPPDGEWDNAICPPSTMCLYGHFTDLVIDKGEGGGPDLGVVLVKLVE